MRARSITLVCATLAAAGCAPPPDYLFVDPHVPPVRVELRRSFGIIHKQYGPVPIAECGFFRKPEAGEPTSAFEEEIWRIVTTPAGGPAPRLQPGGHYVVHCTGDAEGLANFEVPQTVTRTAPPLRKTEP